MLCEYSGTENHRQGAIWAKDTKRIIHTERPLGLLHGQKSHFCQLPKDSVSSHPSVVRIHMAWGTSLAVSLLRPLFLGSHPPAPGLYSRGLADVTEGHMLWVCRPLRGTAAPQPECAPARPCCTVSDGHAGRGLAGCPRWPGLAELLRRELKEAAFRCLPSAEFGSELWAVLIPLDEWECPPVSRPSATCSLPHPGASILPELQ